MARLCTGLLILTGSLLIVAPALAQFAAAPASDLSTAIQVDEASSATRTLLARAAAHAEEKQWDDAIETYRQIMERDGGKLLRLDPSRFATVREFCQLQLASMPADGRAIYRSRVDSLAKRWYEQGVAGRDRQLLTRVVDQLFVSSWGDSALLALGEIALERGDYQEARWCWERISPELRSSEGLPLWLSLRKGGSEATIQPPTEPKAGASKDGGPAKPAALPRWLSYPDTKLNLADVRARLVLVSIMEGSLDRARIELADFNRRHPQAKGRIGGQEAPYAETLARLLKAAQSRPASQPSGDWPTFAGSPERTAIAAEPKSLGSPLWQIPLGEGKPLKADVNNLEIARRNFHWPLPQFRPAEDNQALVSYYPLIVGNLVMFNTVDKVFAFDLRTGKPAWPVAASGAAEREPGEIYCGLKDQERTVDLGDGPAFQAFGAPRFTMTASGGRLYVRLGTPITSTPTEAVGSGGSNYLVCLDLAAEGLLVWRTGSQRPQDERWALEGAPLVDGDNVFIVMRYNDVRPQVHVACLDARNGAIRWRKLICACETVARGQIPEITSDLLTLAGRTLYLNTNLGAIAALSADDGTIRWISGYPRAKKDEANAAHFFRDLNPCVYYRGGLFVAPADTPNILALDAATGQLLWECPHFPETIHLLGVGGNNLIASGRQIYWLDVNTGKVVRDWPDKTAIGYGRGVLVGDQVYWPMRTQIRRFRQQVASDGPLDADEPIQLDRFEPPLSGGNLVAAGGYLLIATPTKLIAFGPGALAPPASEHILTKNDKIKGN